MTSADSDVQVIPLEKELDDDDVNEDILLEDSPNQDELPECLDDGAYLQSLQLKPKSIKEVSIEDVYSLQNRKEDELPECVDVVYSSKVSRAKKIKREKTMEDEYSLHNTENVPIKIEVMDSCASCSSDEYHSSKRLVKREPISECTQRVKREPISECTHRVKLEPSPSPPWDSRYNTMVSCGGNEGGELSAMKQLLMTLQKPVDEDEVFGAHVASEMRTLRRPDLKRKLKRLIQEAILSVAREDDG